MNWHTLNDSCRRSIKLQPYSCVRTAFALKMTKNKKQRNLTDATPNSFQNFQVFLREIQSLLVKRFQ
jgi:hypothetical protein